MGSGPSTYLAHKLTKQGVHIGGLILQSPLLSIYRVAFNFRYTLPGDLFPNIDRFVSLLIHFSLCSINSTHFFSFVSISSVACPVYIIHGTRDEIVPFWNGEDLFLAVPVNWRAKPHWVEGAGHNNIETLLREEGIFFQRMREFIDEWVLSPSFPSSSSSSSFLVKTIQPTNQIKTLKRKETRQDVLEEGI